MTGLPKDISEADLLGVVEGDLPGDRAGVVEGALRADPRLRRLVEAMRGDREALRGLGDVRAPARILESVEMVLEREALLGLTEPAPGSGDVLARLPVSAVVPARRGVWSKPGARRLALAAGLGLAVGVGVWVVSGGPGWLGGSGERLVGVTDGGHAPARNGVGAAVTPDGGLARMDEPGPSGGLDGNDRGAEPEGEALSGGAERTLASGDANLPGDSEAPAERILTSAEALALAREGRLVVRVRARDPEAAARRVAALRERGMVEGLDRLEAAALPGEYAGLARLWEGADPWVGPGVPGGPVYFAHGESDGDGAAANLFDFGPAGLGIVLPVPPPRMWRDPRLPAAVYAVEIEGSSGALESLRSGLGDAARFDELPEAVDAGAPVALDPASVLWWSGPASRWVVRVRVPVVVERGE